MDDAVQVDDAVQAYVTTIAPAQRPLFDRVHDLIVGEYPSVRVVLAYKMPTYVVGRRRLHVAAWKHGVSLYGWREERDGGLVARFPHLASGRGTLRLRPAEAAEIADDELLDLLRGALGPDGPSEG